MLFRASLRQHRVNQRLTRQQIDSARPTARSQMNIGYLLSAEQLETLPSTF